MSPPSRFAVRPVLLSLLVLAAASSRLLPHPPSFTAVPAMALFSGALLGRRPLAFAVPLLAMVLSDLALAVDVHGLAAIATKVSVYASIAAIVCIGFRTSRSLAGIALGAVAATATFFLVTNLVAWSVGGHGLHPRTLAGLVACLSAAVPYAGSMLASTLLYGFALFGLWALAERRVPVLAVSR